MTPDCRVVDTLLEGALKVRDRFGAASESHLLAKVVSSFSADTTLAAGDTDLQSNTVANVEARNLGADGDDGTGGLMSQ